MSEFSPALEQSIAHIERWPGITSHNLRHLIRAEVKAAVAAWKERAIAAACEHCRKGLPVEHSGRRAYHAVNVASASPRGPFVERRDCLAEPLRSLPADRSELDAMLAAEREACAQIIERYAVNLGGRGMLKPLIEDGPRGKNDVVRNAYAAAIRARGEA